MRVIGFGFGLTNFVGKKNFEVKEKIWVRKIEVEQLRWSNWGGAIEVEQLRWSKWGGQVVNESESSR